MSEIPRVGAAEPASDETRQEILVEAGLFARDPSAHPGLSLRMDPTCGLDSGFRPIGYDTRHTTGAMVHCSICAQQQEHFDGAIVRLQDGSVGLVGNTCGKRHFFSDNGWTAITNRIREDAEQAIFMARFGTAKERLATVDHLLGVWANKLKIVESVKAQFESEMPQLFTAIRRQVRGGVLSVDEERQVPFRLSNGEIEMRRETYRVPVCRVEAEWFFLTNGLALDVRGVRPQLTKAGNFLHASATKFNVAAVKKLMRECRNSLEVVADRQRQLASLATENTVRSLAEWAILTQSSQDSYQVSGKVLSRIRGETLMGSVDFGNIPSDLEKFSNGVFAAWPSL
jgi:hypothetical protein